MTARALRVATWNVHGMRGGVEEIARVIHAEDIEILLIQESGPRRRLRALGGTLGMKVFADPPAFPRRRVQNAILLRGSMATVVRSGLRRFSEGALLHPRGMLFADVDERFSVMSAHLGLRGSERGHHIGQLLEHIEASEGRFVIGGDLNAFPGDPGPRMLAARATDCWRAVGRGEGYTFPSHAPRARIDYLFAGP
ncbi:MAG: endonuclease/exonuclease/phosphatase family protein, partial [Actinomycetota bacterium]|nr:endonuclease/exonuclease/phosphatase family protein [Actinomycetota bacterium]